MTERASEPDPKLTALRIFSNASYSARAFEMVERYATDLPKVTEQLLTAARPKQDDWRICELGFGTGWLLEKIAREFPRSTVYGLELSAAMTAYARRSSSLEGGIVQGDIERLPFANGSFDVVLACWTLYFMRMSTPALQKSSVPSALGA